MTQGQQTYLDFRAVLAAKVSGACVVVARDPYPFAAFDHVRQMVAVFGIKAMAGRHVIKAVAEADHGRGVGRGNILIEARQAGLGEVLGFAEHYGRNLDALADCLDDLADDTVLVWEGWGAFATTDEPTFAMVVEILRRRAGRDDAPALSVLLTGAGPALELPDLA